jgi:hypothetical protein
MTTLESAINKLDKELDRAPEMADSMLTRHEIEMLVTAARSIRGIMQIMEMQLDDEAIIADQQ